MDQEIADRIRQFESADRKCRWEAVEALRVIGEPAVEALLEALTAENFRTRGMAARTLGLIGDVCAVPALLSLLRDGHEIVRWQAQNALDRLANSDAVEALRAGQSDPNEFVRYHSIRMLINVNALDDYALITMAQQETVAPIAWLAFRRLVARRVSAFPILQRELENGNAEARCYAAYVLSEMGDVRALPMLYALLQRETPATYYSIQHSLFQIANVEDLPRSVLANSELSAAERAEILETLRQFHADTSNSLCYYLPDILRYCRSLQQDKDEAVRAGANAVSDYLTLMRSGPSAAEMEAPKLLRSASAVENIDGNLKLLRPVEEAHGETTEARSQPGLLKRLFKRAKEAKPYHYRD